MKKPSKRLTKKEWAFHEIPQPMRRAAWHWELSREVAGTKQTWFDLEEKQKKELVEYVADQPICEVNTELITDGYFRDHDQAHLVDYEQLHVFKIRWNRGRRKVLEAFRDWIYSTSPPSQKLVQFSRRDGGGPRDFLGKLVNLAIYRARVRGYSRPEAIQLLTPLFGASKLDDPNDLSNGGEGKVSEKHWPKSIKAAKASIAARGQFYLPHIKYFAKNSNQV